LPYYLELMANSLITDLDLKPKHAREICLAALNETYLLVSWYFEEPSYDRIHGQGRWRGVDTLFEFRIDFRILKGGLVSLRLWTDSNMPGPLQSLETAIQNQRDKFWDSYEQKSAEEQQTIMQGAFDGVVFLSYARRDYKFADKLRRGLYLSDLEVWVDQDYLPPGAKWQREIETAIEKAAALVVVVPPAPLKSKWIPLEISHAMTHQKPILPVVHTAEGLPAWLAEHIGDIETADLIESNYDRGFDELLDAIKTGLTK
jgi:TIR domain